jgi:hypothetical protein
MIPHTKERLHEIEDDFAKRMSPKQSFEFYEWVMSRLDKAPMELNEE